MRRRPLRPQGLLGRKGGRRASAVHPHRGSGDEPAQTAGAPGARHPVDAGVARSRSDALAWSVKLVGEHTEEWLAKLRDAMSAVDDVRAEGPELESPLASAASLSLSERVPSFFVCVPDAIPPPDGDIACGCVSTFGSWWGVGLMWTDGVRC